MATINAAKAKKKSDSLALQKAASELNNNIRQRGTSFATPMDAEHIASFESLTPELKDAVSFSLESHYENLKTTLENLEIQADDAQLSAGALVAMAAANPAAYARKAMTTQTVSVEGIVTVGADEGGAFGTYGYASGIHPQMEAFDNSNLTDFVGQSILYNIQAAKQDAFGEAFFRTTVLTPDNGGCDVSIRNLLVFNHFIHGIDGKEADFGKRRLLDAAMDYKILSDESTTLKPEVLEDDSNADFFVPASAVAPRYLDMGNRTVRTAPLKIGKRLNLIGISQNNLVKKNGVADNTDSLDRMTGVDKVYMQIGSGDVLSFNLKGLPQTFFVKGPEGRNREQILHFTTRSIQLNAETLLADGSAPTNTVLQEIISNKLVVNLGFTLTGDLDVEIGNCVVNAGRVEVVSVHNSAGEKVALESGLGKSVVDNLAQLGIIGWDPNARLTNANRRERGLQLDLNTYTERYPVPLGAPISIPTPLSENNDGGEMNALITAARIRNSNNAVTKLLNYADVLGQFANTIYSSEDTKVPHIEGIARFLIKPWFRHIDLHLPDHIQSLTSHERIADVQAVLVNTIRDAVYDAHRDTNIQAVLDALTGFTGEKVKVLIGTDAILSRYIITPGDTRTLGDGLDFVKVSTQDRRVYGDIYFTFVREGEGLDPLNFGSHLWIPELISNVQVSRNNSHFRELMVQPRSRHIVHLPVLGRIRVTGLNEAVTELAPIPVNTVDDDLVVVPTP